MQTGIDKYLLEATKIGVAIDIAIKSLEKYPNKEWDKETLTHIIKTYSEWKNDALNPETKYRNLTSLKYVKDNVLTLFQESSGDAVEYFWTQIKKENLDFIRENKMEKILKRGKIKNEIELNFIIDVMIPYQQEGMVTQEEMININEMIKKFSEKKTKGKGKNMFLI